jgi:hypothetical protein
MNNVVPHAGNGTYEPYDFGSAEPIFRDKISINGLEYLLREPSEAAVIAYRRAAMRGVTMEDGKISGLEGSPAAEPELVSHCLFQVHPNSSGGRTESQVSLQEIMKWKGSICSKLFDFIKEMCPWLMGEETEEGLTQEMAKLQKRLEKLKKAKPEEGAEGSPKNLPSSTLTT